MPTGGTAVPLSGSIDVSRVGVLPHWAVRAVAQFGSALRSGRRGPRFKSGQPDHRKCRSAGASAPAAARFGAFWGEIGQISLIYAQSIPNRTFGAGMADSKHSGTSARHVPATPPGAALRSLESLAARQFVIVASRIEYSAEQRASTRMPRSRSLGVGRFELRIDLDQKAQRITFFFPRGRRIVLLTTFRIQRQNERTQVDRARLTMARCIAGGHTVEGETE